MFARLVFFFIVLFSGILCLLLQNFIPVIGSLQGATILLLPMLMFVASSMVPYSVMLLLAALFGFCWDLSELVIVPDVGGLRLGISMFLFALLGSLMQGVAPLFRQGRWELPLFFSAVAFFLYLLFFYSAINLRQGDFYYPQSLWLKIGLTTMMSVLFAPMLFYLLYRASGWCGIEWEEEGG